VLGDVAAVIGEALLAARDDLRRARGRSLRPLDRLRGEVKATVSFSTTMSNGVVVVPSSR
jgi:hypothetical protein